MQKGHFNERFSFRHHQLGVDRPCSCSMHVAYFLCLICSLSAFAGKIEIFEGEIDSSSYWMARPSGEHKALPVVYFLHGRGGNRHMFRDLQGTQALENYLDQGGRPFAVVALTGTFEGKDSYWINETRDHIINKIIPEIEKRHQLGGKNQRLISGISMGSHGAFQMGLTTRLFKCVAGHSLVLRSYESMNSQFPGLFGNRVKFRTRDPISLIKRHFWRWSVPFQKVWVDIGGKDVPEFIDRARIMEEELLGLGFRPDTIDVARNYPEGAHDYNYWKLRMPDYINWYGKCFE